MRAGEDDVWLSGQPLFHIGGINGLLPFLTLGATSVVTPTTGFDPDAALERIERHGVTMCIFVPTQWDLLCRAERVESLDRGRLRVAMWGASPGRASDARADGGDLPAGRDRQRVRPDRDGGCDDAAQGRGRRAQDGLGGPADARSGAPRRRRRSPRRAGGRHRRDRVPGPDRHGRLPRRSRRERRGVRRRLVPQRGPRHARRGRLSLAGRSQEGPDHQRRRERLPGGGRAGAARARGRRRRGRGRDGASAVGGDAAGLRGRGG